MLCAISGEAPQVPVVSTKTGTVYEKRLIEAYIAEHGKDPLTGEELSTDDLIELKTARTVRPRPPTLTSIPSLLSVFQNEWDALALQQYTLQQQLNQTRQELSTALYQNDAAVRVIGRLMKERDDARDALARVSIGAGAGTGSDEMQIDSQGMPEYVVEKINTTQQQLSATRKKRAIAPDWATAETVSSFNTIHASEALYPGGKSIALDPSGELALFGGADGVAGIFSIAQNELITPLKSDDGAITDVAWFGTRPITAHASGSVRLWDEKGTSSEKIGSHAGEVTAITLHPCGDLLSSVGVDKSWVTYDLNTGKVVAQVYTESELTTTHFHPDGHLVGLGTADGSILIYDVRETKYAATFGPLAGPVQSLHFSENGIWLAVAVKGETTIEIWDLRKTAKVKSLETGSRVDSIRWDYTGQFIAAAGPSGASVQHYSKSTKSWTEVLKKGIPGVAAVWGARASSLVNLSKEGVVTVLGAQA
ncbi:WD40-repeat-containing domain protein [Peziza echinospora]|nr:WD40-repeat-containing domain protein [Peziza echinospora]